MSGVGRSQALDRMGRVRREWSGKGRDGAKKGAFG